MEMFKNLYNKITRSKFKEKRKQFYIWQNFPHIWGKVKPFIDKQKLKEFATCRSGRQEMLTGVLQVELKIKQ